MRDIERVQINGTTYNIGQANAIDQKSLLSLIGARITLISRANENVEIDIPFLKGSLLGISEEVFDKVADKSLSKTANSETEQLVSVKDFQGKIDDYLTLVAHAVKINLEDFFCWLDNEKAEESRATSNQKSQKAD